VRNDLGNFTISKAHMALSVVRPFFATISRANFSAAAFFAEADFAGAEVVGSDEEVDIGGVR